MTDHSTAKHEERHIVIISIRRGIAFILLSIKNHSLRLFRRLKFWSVQIVPHEL